MVWREKDFGSIKLNGETVFYHNLAQNKDKLNIYKILFSLFISTFFYSFSSILLMANVLFPAFFIIAPKCYTSFLQLY